MITDVCIDSLRTESLWHHSIKKLQGPDFQKILGQT